MKVISIEKPTVKGKKYSAIVEIDGKQKRVNFGAIGYEQYRDSTPLKLYSHLDHGDIKRRRLYHARHALNTGPAGLLSAKYLW